MILSLLIPLTMLWLAHRWSAEHREQVTNRPPPSHVTRMPR